MWERTRGGRKREISNRCMCGGERCSSVLPTRSYEGGWAKGLGEEGLGEEKEDRRR